MDDTLLVDTGFPWARRCLRQTLIRLGADRTVRQVLNTHYHEDHTGNNDLLAELTGAEILAHPLAVPEIRFPPSEVRSRQAIALRKWTSAQSGTSATTTHAESRRPSRRRAGPLFQTSSATSPAPRRNSARRVARFTQIATRHPLACAPYAASSTWVTRAISSRDVDVSARSIRSANWWNRLANQPA